MKIKKLLILGLIGVLFAAGLVLAGCDIFRLCSCERKEKGYFDKTSHYGTCSDYQTCNRYNSPHGEMKCNCL